MVSFFTFTNIITSNFDGAIEEFIPAFTEDGLNTMVSKLTNWKHVLKYDQFEETRNSR